MNKAIKTSRKEFSKHTPKMETITVDKKDIATVIGKGGATIRDSRNFRCKSWCQRYGEVTIAASDENSEIKQLNSLKI